MYSLKKMNGAISDDLISGFLINELPGDFSIFFQVFGEHPQKGGECDSGKQWIRIQDRVP